METSVFIASIALVLALAALWVAWRSHPRRLYADLRLRVEDAEHDLEQLHGRLHKRARQENVGKARESLATERTEGRNVIEEAKAVLAAKPVVAAVPPLTRETLRNKILNS